MEVGLVVVGAVFVVAVQLAITDAVHRIRPNGTGDARRYVVHNLGNAQRLRGFLSDYRSYSGRLATDGRPKEITSAESK